MSIGEFSTFNRFQGAHVKGIRAQERLAQGRLWHQQASKETPEAESELSLQGTFSHKGWTLKLQGRLDQQLPNKQTSGEFTAREVKTTTQTLPIPAERVLDQLPHYCIQAATYAVILEKDNPEERHKAELFLISIETGETQRIQLHKQQDALFEKQLDGVIRTLEAKKGKLSQLEKLSTGTPYKQLREGQKEVLESLHDTAKGDPFIFLEAPTGFGKTGLLLDHALHLLKSGTIEHIIYATGKSTGQLPILTHLEKILPKNAGLNYLQLRSHEELAIDSPLHTCAHPFDTCTRTFLNRFQESGLNQDTLFKSGKLDIKKAQQLGETYGLCPHTLLLYALKWSNLWICDYNYIFSATQRSLLNNYGQWDSKKTLLIIDEAHNLPGRIEQNFSGRTNTQEAIDIYDFLEKINSPIQMLRPWQSLIDHLSSLQPANTLSQEKEESLARALSRAIQSLPAHYPEEPPIRIANALSNTTRLNTLTKDTLNSYWVWSPKHASLQVDCLSAAPSTAISLSRFHSCIFSSATLTPLDDFKKSCGIDPIQGTLVQGHARWKDTAYTTAIDCRVDTRYRRREHFHNETASTIARLAETTESPIAVFFPSYKYAQAIHARLQMFAPWAHITLQERGKTPTEQLQALEIALKESNILLLVLGGSFSEGVDLLGHTIETAVVIGPALPEVNPLQQARLERLLDQGREQAFHQTYIIPGMKKINQALGRLVRAPGQKAKVLLHCQRFAEPAFRNLLPPECKSASILKTEADLENWLNN